MDYKRKLLIKYSLEFIVIVVGISVTFWIDEWNRNRLERIQHIKDIESIIDDLENDSLIIDMSSDIGSYSFEWDNLAYIYAGAQKNMGIPGVSICIGDEQYLNTENNSKYLNLGQLVEKNSLLNTPPTFSIYILKLVTDWMIQMGGVKYFEEKSIRQSSRLYEQLNSYKDFLLLPVCDYSKSRSNIIFKFENNELEKKFLMEAGEKGIIGLNGHRSEGGVRISLYNSITDEMVDYLSEFIDQFFVSNGK